MDDEEKLQHLIDQLLHAETNPGELHVCPICGGKLLVRFGAYKRGYESMVGVTTECESCEQAVAVDYLMPHPVWLKQA